jgi:cytochrome c551/c552
MRPQAHAKGFRPARPGGPFGTPRPARTGRGAVVARPRSRRFAALLAGCLLCGLAGCGSGRSASQTSSDFDEARADAPFTHQQLLVEAGARLFVADGCSVCHSLNRDSRFGPSFAHLAGSHVKLSDGRTVLVDEAFLHAALSDPRANAVTGYSPAAMIAAVKRLGLAGKPQAVDGLAAFIEQIGPEDG